MKAKNLIGLFFTMSMLATATMGTAAQAAMTVYEDVGFIRGSGEQSESFTVADAGSYRVTLTDFSFPNTFGQLSLNITTSLTEINLINGSGWFDFDAIANTTYFANVSGLASGSLNLGLYGVNVTALSTVVSPVPLPATFFMMASALIILGALRRSGSAVARARFAVGGALSA